MTKANLIPNQAAGDSAQRDASPPVESIIWGCRAMRLEREATDRDAADAPPWASASLCCADGLCGNAFFDNARKTPSGEVGL